MRMSFFQDKVVVITGGSDGIGKALIEALIPLGAKIATCGRNHDKIYKLQMEYAGVLLHAVACDVSNEQECRRFIESTSETFGGIDILINNAGLQRDSPFQDMTLEQWNFVLGVNLTGQFLCAREAIREFLRRGLVPERSISAGKIICMSSVHEVIPWAGHANYAASKGGIMMMMKSIAQEFAPWKIRINSIAPGAIKTPINHQAWDTPAAEKRLLELIPYGRVGVVEDIGAAAVWLASDDSEYVTGTTLFVDGGMTLYPGFSTNG